MWYFSKFANDLPPPRDPQCKNMENDLQPIFIKSCGVNGVGWLVWKSFRCWEVFMLPTNGEKHGFSKSYESCRTFARAMRILLYFRCSIPYLPCNVSYRKLERSFSKTYTCRMCKRHFKLCQNHTLLFVLMHCSLQRL